MSLVDDVRGEITTAKSYVPWWGVLCVVIGSYLCAELLDKLGKLDLVVPILNTVVVLGFMLALKRKLWQHAWFWVTMFLIALIHVPLILFVPWGTKWVPALAIAVIDSADFCLILWIISAVGKFNGDQKTDDVRADSL